MSGPRENSVRQLSELYNVVIGIALSISIYSSIDVTGDPIPVKIDRLVNLASFLIIIIPFYHGAVRHLFATYVENGGSTRIKNGALLADFILLFLEGCIFILLASILGDTIKFAWTLVFLLLLDSIWGFLAWLAFTGAQSQYAERKWAKINIVTAAIFTLILIYADGVFQTKPMLSQFGILVVVAIRTIIDYSSCWSFYFPEHETKNGQSS